MNMVRFLQDIPIMKKGFVGRWNCGILAEFCWSIVRETLEKWFQKKTIKKNILKLFAYKIIDTKYIKILQINI